MYGQLFSKLLIEKYSNHQAAKEKIINSELILAQHVDDWDSVNDVVKFSICETVAVMNTVTVTNSINEIRGNKSLKINNAYNIENPIFEKEIKENIIVPVRDDARIIKLIDSTLKNFHESNRFSENIEFLSEFVHCSKEGNVTNIYSIRDIDKPFEDIPKHYILLTMVNYVPAIKMITSENFSLSYWKKARTKDTHLHLKHN